MTASTGQRVAAVRLRGAAWTRCPFPSRRLPSGKQRRKPVTLQRTLGNGVRERSHLYLLQTGKRKLPSSPTQIPPMCHVYRSAWCVVDPKPYDSRRPVVPFTPLALAMHSLADMLIRGSLVVVVRHVYTQIWEISFTKTVKAHRQSCYETMRTGNGRWKIKEPPSYRDSALEGADGGASRASSEGGRSNPSVTSRCSSLLLAAARCCLLTRPRIWQLLPSYFEGRSPTLECTALTSGTLPKPPRHRQRQTAAVKKSGGTIRPVASAGAGYGRIKAMAAPTTGSRCT